MRLYMVMKRQPWSALTMEYAGGFGGPPVKFIDDGAAPEYFIPVFKDRTKAIAWAGGDEALVVACDEVEPVAPP